MTRERTTTWDDPAISAGRVGRDSGMAMLEAVRDGRLPAPPIAATLGVGLGYTSIDLNVKFVAR